MVRSLRTSHSATAVPRPGRDAAHLRGRDVVVTCRDRSRDTAADDPPAPRLLTGFSDAIGPGTLQVAVGAELVAGRVADIRSVVEEALRRSPQVLTLRLDEVERFDAAGVGLLLRLSASARRQGTALRCTAPPRQLVVALHRTRTVHVLTVVA